MLRTVLALLADLLRLLRLMFRPRGQLVAENLFLRKQLACYVERQVRPRRADNATRIALVLLSRVTEICFDCAFPPAVDEARRAMSLHVLKTLVRAPQANAHRERFIGTVRRECLDWMILLNERHLRSVLAEVPLQQ